MGVVLLNFGSIIEDLNYVSSYLDVYSLNALQKFTETTITFFEKRALARDTEKLNLLGPGITKVDLPQSFLFLLFFSCHSIVYWSSQPILYAICLFYHYFGLQIILFTNSLYEICTYVKLRAESKVVCEKWRLSEGKSIAHDFFSCIPYLWLG